MKELLLCTLARAGVPLTSNDVLDQAGILATDAGWPTSAYAAKSVPMISALLKNLEAEGLVAKSGTEKVRGVDRPLWAIDPKIAAQHLAVPPPPETARTKHVIDQFDRSQLAEIFDAQDDSFQLLLRQRKEMLDLMCKHGEEYHALIKRVRRNLHAHEIEL